MDNICWLYNDWKGCRPNGPKVVQFTLHDVCSVYKWYSEEFRNQVNWCHFTFRMQFDLQLIIYLIFLGNLVDLIYSAFQNQMLFNHVPLLKWNEHAGFCVVFCFVKYELCEHIFYAWHLYLYVCIKVGLFIYFLCVSYFLIFFLSAIN